MKFSHSLGKQGGWYTFLLLMVFLNIGCESLFKKKEPSFVARVGENYLFEEDIKKLLIEGMSKEDSASFVTNYINNWASKQLLLDRAKINLPEEKLGEYDALVADYRADLYTRAYKDALVRHGIDTIITESQLENFYESEKENFKLKEKVVQIRFVELPKQFLNKDQVIDKLKSFKPEDQTYLDSIGVQFKKLNFNDSIWVSAPRVIGEIAPLTFENADKHLKKSQFFEMEDDNGVYLAKVVDVKNINDTAPLSFVEPQIKQVLLSRRKLDFLRQLETEVLDEAIKKNEFEIYAEDE
ncbi:peptidylprolyl isomerase [Euzebyella saccharophila]|uniref:Peptidylprolyl isomerase n=1 Tax=Euzebyella saccharophila TaxID=679664 RepID=A0ABV8JMP7_9FLAO|nr:peptidylprolyl isomerase [Euzebyella saccharophila]